MSHPQTEAVSTRRRRTLIALSLFGAVLISGWVWNRYTSPSPRELLIQSRAAFTRRNYAEAEKLATRLLALSPQNSQALVLAGDSAARQQQFHRALDYYERIADDGSAEAISGCLSAGLVYRELGLVSEAEDRFRRVLKQEPHHVAANNAMAHLLGFEGRSWEAMPYYFEPIRQGHFLLNHLLLLGSTAPIVQDPTLLAKCQAAAPDDPLPHIAEARHALFEGQDPQQAKAILQRIVAAAPHQMEAQARLGWVLVDSGQPQEFARWHAQLPAGANAHPEIWTVRGMWALDHNQVPVAVRCFWEGVRRYPDHQVANYQLGQALRALGQDDNARPFLVRAGRLSELSENVEFIRRDPRNVSRLHRAFQVCETLGRIWEAWGWCSVAAQIDQTADWPHREAARLQRQLHATLPRVLPSANPAGRIDLSSYPLPDGDRLEAEMEVPQSTREALESIHFQDVSSEAGIAFRYFNGSEPMAQTNRMFEFNGGGIAVLDYDQDGWPDVFFTQGCHWPPVDDSRELRDRLFRNQGNGRFLDVTLPAQLGDRAFSQGTAAGDINNDGFPDVYVGNIGSNRLYRNNGDGTFTDVTAETGTGGQSWTTSCLIADLNGDQWPDIYAVNYLAGDDVFSKVCTRPSGLTSGCGPEEFPAAQDRLYLNCGDGRFQDVTTSCGIEVRDGKGLGIAAADFGGCGLLNVYVANDTTPNFYFVNIASKRGAPLSFSENGLISGLALDGQGRPQAGMGIAVGDAHNDGLIDLFVTNYYREANTLYRQHGPLLFQDRTQPAGLYQPGYLMLGFGTQFLDADLDGWNDLVVANGHVHNLTAEGLPYQMPLQFFRNTGEGRFREVSAETLGDYFQEKRLGRALATLDFNRDGLVDFAVSNLDGPAAVLSNRSTTAGHFLSIKLCGLQSSRDAIGTTLWATADDHQWVRQLTAGDGYQASNQRQIHFGFGRANRIETLKVRWPTGREQAFHNVPADREVLLIEGHPQVMSDE